MWFVLGLMVGGTAGVMVMAMMSAAKESDVGLGISDTTVR
jgi:hypothetical protein